MVDFKVGDILKCIDAKDMEFSLKVGALYAVIHVNQNGMTMRYIDDLGNIKDTFCFPYRFIDMKTHRNITINNILEK